MHHSCSRYGVASCFPSRGSSGSRGIQRVLPQYAIGEPIFPYLLVLSLCISKGHAQIVDESGRPVTPLVDERFTAMANDLLVRNRFRHVLRPYYSCCHPVLASSLVSGLIRVTRTMNVVRECAITQEMVVP